MRSIIRAVCLKARSKAFMEDWQAPGAANRLTEPHTDPVAYHDTVPNSHEIEPPDR
jgi:hypothetical protein